MGVVICFSRGACLIFSPLKYVVINLTFFNMALPALPNIVNDRFLKKKKQIKFKTNFNRYGQRAIVQLKSVLQTKIAQHSIPKLRSCSSHIRNWKTKYIGKIFQICILEVDVFALRPADSKILDRIIAISGPEAWR